ncbi:YceI-like domain-containing protein [Arcicella aurantiaca]|uniref:YceI-like domain-containing protein n=1 Tax=Arcicella aurantiaca TaxID=591202 RepID=A0A316DUT7_9BACT|nr:YceI family protein [Arcicella aurantiaca]PWK22087.1 YceI-like domain-containing protein [Arcicella aurantiaca]
MKKILLLLLTLSALESLYGQKIYISKSSSVKLFSEAPLEDISTNNKSSKLIIDFEKQEIAVKIPMNKFVFPNKLMETHFKESYAESTIYPYATFKGFFNKKVDLTKSANISISATGMLNIHGVTKMEIIEGRLVIDPNKRTIIIDSNFRVKLDDFDMKVPKVLSYKIAENVEVTTHFVLTPILGELNGTNHLTQNTQY